MQVGYENCASFSTNTWLCLGNLYSVFVTVVAHTARIKTSVVQSNLVHVGLSVYTFGG